MPRLPSSQNVPQVSPEVTRDPGLKIPAKAFESPLSTISSELAPAVNKYVEVARRQQNREDAIRFADKTNRYTLEIGDKFRKLNTEADLSRGDVLKEYGTFLSSTRDALLKEHREEGASAESLASLDIRLRDIEARATGEAAGVSTIIGRKKAETAFENGLKPLITKASDEPTLENISRLFLDMETQAGDLAGAFDPNEEEKIRAAGRENIALSAVNTLIARGHAETAESLLKDGGLIQALGPDKQREVTNRIETMRFSRDKLAREISETESILGRRLTQEELLAKVGLGKNAPGTKSVFNRKTNELQFATDAQILADPNLVPVDSGKTEKITSAERLAAGYAMRAGLSNKTIDEVGSKFVGAESRAGEMLPQELKSEDRQRLEQAQRNFVNAVLRRESGAVISPSEFEGAAQQYLPRPGDSEQVLQQKKQNRITVQKSLELEAGPAFQQLKATVPDMVKIGNKNILVGTIVTNGKGQKGRVEQDGSVTILE